MEMDFFSDTGKFTFSVILFFKNKLKALETENINWFLIRFYSHFHFSVSECLKCLRVWKKKPVLSLINLHAFYV